MTICHSHRKSDPFVRFSKSIAFDSRLSWKAKGILTVAFSRPESWTFYKEELMKHASDGETSFDSGIKELEEHGYLYRLKTRDEKTGQLKGWEWNFFEDPITPEEFKKFHRNGGFPDIGKSPTSVKPGPNKNDTVIKNENNNSPPPDSQPKDYSGWMPCRDLAPPDGDAAAVFSCLENEDIPRSEKEWLTEHFEEKAVVHALEYCKNPATVIKTTFLKTLKWACKVQPEMPTPKEPDDIVTTNKEKVRKAFSKILGKKTKVANGINVMVEMFNKYVEISTDGAREVKIFDLDNPYCLNELKDYIEKKLPCIYKISYG
jgi:hypothetical protein